MEAVQSMEEVGQYWEEELAEDRELYRGKFKALIERAETLEASKAVYAKAKRTFDKL